MIGKERERFAHLEDSKPSHERSEPAIQDLDAHPAAGCTRYFRACAARDLEAVLDAMTPEYGRQLSDMRRLPEFDAFFSLWCENQGRLLAVLSTSVYGDCATVAVNTDHTLVFVKLCLIHGCWRIDSERVAVARKASPGSGAK
jgi:hypothetical protein